VNFELISFCKLGRGSGRQEGHHMTLVFIKKTVVYSAILYTGG